MLRQGAVHRENRFSSWGNKTSLLRFFGNKTTQFFSGQSDWPADNSRKVRLAGMPATAGSLPPMCIHHAKQKWSSYLTRAKAKLSILERSRFVVGSSRASTPQWTQNVSARASRMMREARTYRKKWTKRFGLNTKITFCMMENVFESSSSAHALIIYFIHLFKVFENKIRNCSHPKCIMANDLCNLNLPLQVDLTL